MTAIPRSSSPALMRRSPWASHVSRTRCSRAPSCSATDVRVPTARRRLPHARAAIPPLPIRCSRGCDETLIRARVRRRRRALPPDGPIRRRAGRPGDHRLESGRAFHRRRAPSVRRSVLAARDRGGTLPTRDDSELRGGLDHLGRPARLAACDERLVARVATVLLVMLLARWVPTLGAAAAGLVF